MVWNLSTLIKIGSSFWAYSTVWTSDIILKKTNICMHSRELTMDISTWESKPTNWGRIKIRRVVDQRQMLIRHNHFNLTVVYLWIVNMFKQLWRKVSGSSLGPLPSNLDNNDKINFPRRYAALHILQNTLLHRLTI